MPHTLEDLTVCITSFKRAAFLDRALRSARAAGIQRIAVAAVCPGRDVLRALQRHGFGWRSFDVSIIPQDVGCNETWIVALYRSRTERVIVLHDDDQLLPEFGNAYLGAISPALRSGAGFASWRAVIEDSEGRRHPTEYTRFRTGTFASSELWPVFMTEGRLSLSPVVSIFDRATAIHACKEAGKVLRHNDCLERPGMLLGTEILVYARHVQRFPLWHHLDAVLSIYGSHAGSGTVRAEGEDGGIARLARGYDRARAQAKNESPTHSDPRMIIVTNPHDTGKLADRRRTERARDARRLLCGFGEAIEMEVMAHELPNTFVDSRLHRYPTIADLLDWGCDRAMDEDFVVFCNSDAGLTLDAPWRLRYALLRSGGVAYLPRRQHEDPPAVSRNCFNCRIDGGVDAIAVRPGWWRANRGAWPPGLVIGAQAWDTAFRVFAHERADGGPPRNRLMIDPHAWSSSFACCDGVCWHIPHDAPWKRAWRTGRRDEANAHNRAIAREFFAARDNQDGLLEVEERIRR